eukprot:TRINITY_DN21381_c0_g1_i1.p1 TRINITY_DN21381_c0_g1~~TRINITY_DN21381_c0_g1_i1.p1  ORF type:complete len:653 (-),score=113.38 TRINITY_DN21381_c0_g1_i1:164-2122(-)
MKTPSGNCVAVAAQFSSMRSAAQSPSVTSSVGLPSSAGGSVGMRGLLRPSQPRLWLRFYTGAVSDIGSAWSKSQKRDRNGFHRWPSFMYPYQPRWSMNSITPHYYDKTGSIYSGRTLDETNPGTAVVTWSRLMEERHQQFRDARAKIGAASTGGTEFTPGEWNRHLSRRAPLVGYFCRPYNMFDGHGNSKTVTPIYVPQDSVIAGNGPDFVNIAIGKRAIVDLEEMSEFENMEPEQVLNPRPLRQTSGLFQQRTQCWRAGLPIHRGMLKAPVTPDCVLPVGHRMDVRHFVPGQYVTVLYRSEYRPMMDYFSRKYARHGDDMRRSAGRSYMRVSQPGSKTPGRIFGPHGRNIAKITNPTGTLKVRQEVVGVDARHRLVYVTGSFPSALGGVVVLYDDPFETRPHWMPFPTFYPEVSEDTSAMRYRDAVLFTPGRLPMNRDMMYTGPMNLKLAYEVPTDSWEKWQGTLTEMHTRTARGAFGAAAGSVSSEDKSKVGGMEGSMKRWSPEAYAELLGDMAPPFRFGPHNPEWAMNQHGVAYMKEKERRWLKRRANAFVAGEQHVAKDDEREPDFGRLNDVVGLRSGRDTLDGRGVVHNYHPPLPRQTDWRFPHHDPPRANPRLDGHAASVPRNEFEQGGNNWSRWMVAARDGFGSL